MNCVLCQKILKKNVQPSAWFQQIHMSKDLSKGSGGATAFCSDLNMNKMLWDDLKQAVHSVGKPSGSLLLKFEIRIYRLSQLFLWHLTYFHSFWIRNLMCCGSRDVIVLVLKSSEATAAFLLSQISLPNLQISNVKRLEFFLPQTVTH